MFAQNDLQGSGARSRELVLLSWLGGLAWPFNLRPGMVDTTPPGLHPLGKSSAVDSKIILGGLDVN